MRISFFRGHASEKIGFPSCPGGERGSSRLGQGAPWPRYTESKLWVRGASRGHSRARTCAPHGTAPLSEALGRSRIQHYSVADRAPIVIGLIAYREF